MRKMLILSALLCVLTMIAPAQSIYYSGSPVIGSSCAGLPPNVAGYITPTGQIDVCQVVPPATSPVWVVRASPPALISGVLASIPSTCSPGVSFFQAIDQPPGSQVYACTSTNTWTLQSGVGVMIYPPAGVGNSTGSAWTTSYIVGTSANNLVQLNGSGQLPAVSGALLTNLPLGSVTTKGDLQGFSTVGARVPVGTDGLPLVADSVQSVGLGYEQIAINTAISGLATGIATWLMTPSSANLLSALTTSTGTGSAVFSISPALTGIPIAPTASGGTNTTQLATTAFVQAAVPTVIGGTCTNQVVSAISNHAVPSCSTITSADVDTSIAQTGTDINTSNQVTATHLASPLPQAQGGLATGKIAFTPPATAWTIVPAADNQTTTLPGGTVAPINNPTFTGTPAAPTATTGTNTTQLATTAFVQSAIVSGCQLGGGAPANCAPSFDTITLTNSNQTATATAASATMDVLSFTLAANVTSYVINSLLPNQLVMMNITQPAGQDYTVASPSGFPTVAVCPNDSSSVAKITTTVYQMNSNATAAKFISGSVNTGTGCFPEQAAPTEAPPSGFQFCWNDSTSHTQECEDSSSNIYQMVKLGTGVAMFLATPSGANFNSMIAAGGVPIAQNSQSTAYVTVLGDGGGQILHPTADNNARTFTIAANASVAYPIGTVLTFINQVNTVTIAINSDTLQLAGTSTTGSRTLATGGIATAIKITSTLWYISGPGLT